MPWGVAAAAITAGGAIYAASQQADAAQGAAGTQSAAASEATAEARRQYDQTRADQAQIHAEGAPFRAQGTAAVNKLGELLGLTGGTESGALTRQFTGADLPNDPGYQFGLRQGEELLRNRAAASGNLYSGATGKALQRYGTDYAATKFNDAFNRDLQARQLRGNQLAGLSGTGQTAVGQLRVPDSSALNQIGQNIIGSGDAQAAAQLARGSSYGNAFNQVAGMGANYFRQQQQQPWQPSYNYIASAGDRGYINPLTYEANYG
jgi:hypothetical protein